jgi:hypothetical protein
MNYRKTLILAFFSVLVTAALQKFKKLTGIMQIYN